MRGDGMFQSTPRARRRADDLFLALFDAGFQSTPPRGGAAERRAPKPSAQHFNPRPARGGEQSSRTATE